MRSHAVVVGMFCCCLSISLFAANYGGGAGTVEDPYQIWTPEQMNTIGANSGDWGKSFKLMADLDMSVYTGTQYNRIGNGTIPFSGAFDGNGHIIRNLTYTTAAVDHLVGLFGQINGGTVGNLGLENVTLSTGGNWVGGVVGYCYYATITSCYVTGSVSGAQGTGGLAGMIDYSTVMNSYAMGSVSCSNRDVGGVAGRSNYGNVSYCYATSVISGPAYVGGMVGYNEGYFIASFWDTQTSGTTDGVGNQNPDPSGLTGKTTAQMKTLSTFTDSGWDFSATDGDAADWWMPFNDYPRLAWNYPYGGGSGTTEDPYLIMTAEQMNAIGLNTGDWASHFKLMADIDMSAYTGTQYNIIGNNTLQFTGTFDGSGLSIANVTINRPGTNGIGLFGVISSGGQISNLGVENANIVGSTWVGILCGRNYYGTISQSYATGTAAGVENVGGLCGETWGTITRCYAAATVTGSNANIGGLVGGNRYTTISQCYATGAVTGNSYVGGLVGGNELGTITQSYSTGAVSGYYGFCGGNYDGTITNCFWDTQTSGQAYSDGGTGKTTAQMQTLSTFTGAGWDFSATDGDAADWFLPYRQYPRLSWEPIYGQVNGGSGTTGDPYLIYTAGQLNTIGLNTGDWNKSFKLMADIDMGAYTGTQYNRIGNDTSSFTGAFDGNRHIIRNLSYTTPSVVHCVGLFGTIQGGTVKNLGLENVTLSTGGDWAGGVVGYCYYATITSCYVTGSVSCSQGAGGLAGMIDYSTIAKSYATSSVGCSNQQAGGVTGNSYYGSVNYCYATCSVSGPAYVGGLVGYSNGYFTADFWDTQTSGTTDGVGNLDPDPSGAAGKTTAQMQTLLPFVNAGWDFSAADGDEADWQMPSGYPRLIWEDLGSYCGDMEHPYPTGDINLDCRVDLADFALFAAHWLECTALECN